MGISVNLRLLRRFLAILKVSARRAISFRRLARAQVLLVRDDAGWFVDSMARDLEHNLPDLLQAYRFPAFDARFARNKVIHTLSTWLYFGASGENPYHPSNQLIAIWWHGRRESRDPNIPPTVAQLQSMAEEVSLVHVTCTVSRDTVLAEGVDEAKVVFLPQGVNLRTFQPPRTSADRVAAKHALGIPADSLCVGLFQKDGVGWGEGEAPKWIKGPDVFIEAMARLAELRKVFALIPGPARGYVRRGLEQHGIPYRADGWVPSGTPMSRYYFACDLYMIPARDEGGPAALLEAMASGTPVVATRVGMAPDLISHGENGFLTDLEDATALAEYAEQLASDRDLCDQFSEEGLRTIQFYDWSVVSRMYAEQMYFPLLQS